MTKIISKRSFSLGLDKAKSTLKGVLKHKRKYVHNVVHPGQEVDVPSNQADWFVKVGWANYLQKDKKAPKDVKVTTDMLKGKKE
jgi:hypothetical protein